MGLCVSQITPLKSLDTSLFNVQLEVSPGFQENRAVAKIPD